MEATQKVVATPAKKVKAPKAVVEKPVVERVIQNGITRPQLGTATGRVWEIADTISSNKGAAASRKEVIDAATLEGLNVATVSTQYGLWCKFYGVQAVKEPKVVVAKAPKEPKAPKEKKAKAPKVEVTTDTEPKLDFSAPVLEAAE